MLLSTRQGRRLLAWLLALTVLALPVAAGIAYASYWRAASEVVSERDRQLAFLSAARLRDELAKYSDVLHVLARMPGMTQVDPARRTETLRAASARLAIFDGGVALLDNFGEVVAVEPERPALVGQDWSNRSFFLRLLGGPSTYYSNAVADGPQGSLVIVISVPVLGERGEFTGALAGMFRLDGSTTSAFYASIVRLRLGQTGSTYVIDGQGWMLYDSGAAGLQTAGNARGIYSAALSGAGTVQRTRDLAGNEVIAAYAPVPGTDWILVTEDDWDIVTAPIRRSGRFLLGVISAGVLFPLAGGLMLIRGRQLDARLSAEAEDERKAVSLLCAQMLPDHVPLLVGWEAAVERYESRVPAVALHDFYFLDDGRLGFILADSDGANLATALAMASLRAAVRHGAGSARSLAEVLQAVNASLMAALDPGETIGCLVGLLDPTSGVIRLVSAGCPVPGVLGVDGPRPALAPGPALGSALDAVFTVVELSLAPGEILLMVSHDDPDGSPDGGLSHLAIVAESIRSRPLEESLDEELSAALRLLVQRQGPPSHGLTVLALARRDEGPAGSRQDGGF